MPKSTSELCQSRLLRVLEAFDQMPVPPVLCMDVAFAQTEPESSELISSIVALVQDRGEERTAFDLGVPDAYQLWDEGVIQPTSSQTLAKLIIVSIFGGWSTSPKRCVWSAAQSESHLDLVLPDFYRLINEEGLVRLADAEATPHGFSIDGRVVPFNRLFGSSLAEPFLSAILDLHCRSGVAVALAPDYFRALPQDHRTLRTKAHQFGRPLRSDDLDDIQKVGCTVHIAQGSSRSTEAMCRVWAIDRLEILWSSKEGYKTFQIEEIMHEPRLRMPCYAHAIRDTREHHFCHFDGAAMIYTGSQWFDRVNGRLGRQRVKPSFKQKLFRIDGPLSELEWANLLSLFFAANPLITEYLSTA